MPVPISLERALALVKQKYDQVSYHPEPLFNMTDDELDRDLGETGTLLEIILRQAGQRANRPISEVEECVAEMRRDLHDARTNPNPTKMNLDKFGLIGKYEMKAKLKPSSSTEGFLDVHIEFKRNGNTSRRQLRRLLLWKCDDRISYPRVIVLRGETGSGKTTICSYIYDTFNVSSTRITELRDYKLVVPVQASTVSTCDIIEFLRPSMSQTMDMCDPEEIPNFLESSRILWLIDGFEEATDAAKQLVDKLFAAQANNSHLVLLTTQPHLDLDDVFACVSKESILQVHLQGLSKQGVTDFLWNGLGKGRRKFIKELKLIGEDLLKESHNPMKLKLMVELWKDGRLSKEAGASSLYEALVEAHTEKVKEKLVKETSLNDEDINKRVRAWMLEQFE